MSNDVPMVLSLAPPVPRCPARLNVTIRLNAAAAKMRRIAKVNWITIYTYYNEVTTEHIAGERDTVSFKIFLL